MAWLRSPIHVAAECGPASWTVAAAERARDRIPALVAAAHFDRESPLLSEEFARFRRQQKLPSSTTVILWPEPDDAGVVALDARGTSTVSLPKARVIREIMAPLVRAGTRVKEVVLPHEAVGHLVALAGWAAACVLIVDEGLACLAVVEGGAVSATYLKWAPVPAAEGETARLLARYQFAARLAPYLQDSVARVPSARVAVCGRLPNLRSAMVPLVEEFDREVEVLDAALVGQALGEAFDPDDVSGRQLAWSMAAEGRP